MSCRCRHWRSTSSPHKATGRNATRYSAVVKPAFRDGQNKERLDARITAANGGKAIPHFTLHDLRRTFATYAGGGLPEHEFKRLPPRDKELASGLGILPHVVEAILNHVSGHWQASHRFTIARPMPRKNAPRSTCGQRHLELIVTSAAANVTTLRRAKA